jgi:endonuclease/exonuclease/phosphatase family metal-dependent hydrolase
MRGWAAVLRVLTINLWGPRGPVDARMGGLVAYLGDERPNVVAMQEVEDWGGQPQADRIAAEAGYPLVHRVRSADDGEGLAVVTDLDSELALTVRLPDAPGDPPRALQLVDVVTGDGTVVRIGNTHLAWRLDATLSRAEQARVIRDQFQRWAGPAVLAGDLNDVPGSLPLQAAAEAGLADCVAAIPGAERWTFDPANPYAWQPELLERRVDHILARGLAVVDAAVVLDGRDGPVVSDHYGVRATLATG